MWTVSSKADYALSMVSVLTRSYGQGPISLRQISQDKKLPYKFLEQIARDLKLGGVVVSLEGRKGGYELARDPSQLSMKQALDAVEDLSVVRCCRVGVRCAKEKDCDQRSALMMIQRRLVDELDKISLAEMVVMKKE